MATSLTRRRLFTKGPPLRRARHRLSERHRLWTGARGRDRAHVSRMDLTRNRPRTHDAAGDSPAPGHRQAGRRPHRGLQPLLLERRRGPRHSGCSANRHDPSHTRQRRSHRSQHERHGAHPGSWRRGRRRGRRSGRAAGASGRPCLCLGHATVWLLLPLPARAGRRVPTARSKPRRCPRARRRTARWHARLLELAHRRAGRADDHA